MMEQLTCSICESKFMLVNFFNFSDHKVYTCPTCKVRFTPSYARNEEIYNEEYVMKFPDYFISSNIDYLTNPKLLQYVKVKNKKVLDIGCGTGSFLKTLKEENEVLGVEISKVYLPYLEKEGIPYISGDIEENMSKLPDSYYDLITLWDVFEHLTNPRRILKLIKQKLSINGIIINWTNNYDDYISRFAELIYKLTNGNLYALMERSFNRASGHHYNFVPECLEQLYKEFGFEVLQTIITDTPTRRITRNIPFRIVLKVFYLANSISGKGKIVCHVLKKTADYEKS